MKLTFWEWVVLLCIVGCMVATAWQITSLDKHDQRRDQYLSDHKCVTVSYAGRNAEPVYQCDNGLVMRKQIP